MLNSAVLSTTGTVISSAIEKINEELPKLPELDATGPFLRVIVEGLGVRPVVSTKKVTMQLPSYVILVNIQYFLQVQPHFLLMLHYQ